MRLSKQHIQLIYHRLFNQHIITADHRKAQDIVRWLGAVQSQEYGMAKWALGLRSTTLNEAAIEKEFNEGLILRTHVLRPTWHFVTPEDIRWMLALTAPRVHGHNTPYYKKMELDNKVLKKSKDVLIKNLRDNNFLDRKTIQDIFQRSKIRTDDLRMILIMMHAELEGIICSGPRKGKQFTYALLEERAPDAKPLTNDESLYKLAHCYFTSRSPATVQDFSWWSGLTVKDAMAAAAMLPADFAHETIDGKTYVVNTNTSVELPPSKHARLHASFLMPDYDEYGISYKDRSVIFALVDPATLKRGYNPVFSHVVVVDGVIAGDWKPIIKKKAIDVEINLFSNLTKLQLQLVKNAVNRYKSFHNK